MSPQIIIGLMVLAMPFVLIIWNRQRIKGKMLCYFVREDKSVVTKLCQLRDAFVLNDNRAYDVYPDMVRLTKFPTGWPTFLQELVPCALYDEEDAVPLDWIQLSNRLERSMELRSALDENWIRKLVQETSRESGGFNINWRRILPIGLVAVGILGLILMLTIK